MWYFAGGYPGLYSTLSDPPLPVPPRFDQAHYAVAIPMTLVTRGLTRPVVMARQALIPLSLVTEVMVPMTRGLANEIAIPMRMVTSVTLERA